MAEPLTRMDTAGEGVLADASLRLERALQTLEHVLAAAPRSSSSPPTSSAQVVELQAARRRGRELETATAEASQALGRAAAEVQRVLDLDDMGEPDPQASLFDSASLDSALESEPGLPDDDQVGVSRSAPEEEPTE